MSLLQALLRHYWYEVLHQRSTLCPLSRESYFETCVSVLIKTIIFDCTSFGLTCDHRLQKAYFLDLCAWAHEPPYCTVCLRHTLPCRIHRYWRKWSFFVVEFSFQWHVWQLLFILWMIVIIWRKRSMLLLWSASPSLPCSYEELYCLDNVATSWFLCSLWYCNVAERWYIDLFHVHHFFLRLLSSIDFY